MTRRGAKEKERGMEKKELEGEEEDRGTEGKLSTTGKNGEKWKKERDGREVGRKEDGMKERVRGRERGEEGFHVNSLWRAPQSVLGCRAAAVGRA